MPLIPLFVQNEVQPDRDADLISAFNFCNPFDDVLPGADATISELDMQHLWGLSTSVVVGGVAFSADFTASATFTADLSTAINLASALTVSGTFTADLDTAVEFKTDLTASAEFTADLSTAIAMASDFTASATMTGFLEGTLTPNVPDNVLVSSKTVKNSLQSLTDRSLVVSKTDKSIAINV